MGDEIYHQLKERMDQYTVGFATTESGVEMKILEKLFTQDEAEMYLNLTEELQTSDEIAEKCGGNPAEVEAKLRSMTEKGLTFPRFPKNEGESFYFAAAPFFHGILEHQVKRMDKELAELLEEFFIAGPITRLIPALRTIPVEKAVDNQITVAPYDDVRSVIRNKDRIALTDCVCDVWQNERGADCDKPREVCMLFDFYGEYYVDLGLGRWISQEEALAKLEECEEAGLIAQLSNSDNPEALCNCCSDCCGTLRTLKKLPMPGLLIPTNHFAKVNADLCTGDETCLDRCPMAAITMNSANVAEIELQRCLGCGLCVSTCPGEALSLEGKPDGQRFVPPEKGVFMRPSSDFEEMITEKK
ncbi:MAG: 4Fe-4S dicluster domain-containing protein [Proteobacteria bacterium]|nr:4Fe-4S dicluster domain-containing protein [Pseudomonadota bacterium]